MKKLLFTLLFFLATCTILADGVLKVGGKIKFTPYVGSYQFSYIDVITAGGGNSAGIIPMEVYGCVSGRHTVWFGSVYKNGELIYYREFHPGEEPAFYIEIEGKVGDIITLKLRGDIIVGITSPDEENDMPPYAPREGYLHLTF